MKYKDEHSERYAYLDFLATALTQHEKKLDESIKRLETISIRMSKILEIKFEKHVKKNYVRNDVLNTLIKKAKNLITE